jgi:hypothetical protein
VNWVLLDDPRDLAAHGAAVAELLAEPARAEEIGRNARERVGDCFLSVRSLLDYTALIRRVMARAARTGAGRPPPASRRPGGDDRQPACVSSGARAHRSISASWTHSGGPSIAALSTR